MGKSDYQHGRDDAYSGDYDPPENLIGETLDSSINRDYESRRDDYEQGLADRKGELEHDGE
jgi:hypothetical protein